MDLQLDALKKAGCDKIYEDTISGTKTQRPGLDQALDTLRDGDTLVVWKLDHWPQRKRPESRQSGSGTGS